MTTFYLIFKCSLCLHLCQMYHVLCLAFDHVSTLPKRGSLERKYLYFALLSITLHNTGRDTHLLALGNGIMLWNEIFIFCSCMAPIAIFPPEKALTINKEKVSGKNTRSRLTNPNNLNMAKDGVGTVHRCQENIGLPLPGYASLGSFSTMMKIMVVMKLMMIRIQIF